MIVSAKQPPKDLSIELNDLTSRLQQMICYHLKPLADEQLQYALQYRALQSGMQLSSEVAQYILSRWPRDMSVLVALLDKLDQASIESQRHVTIPFLKEVVA